MSKLLSDFTLEKVNEIVDNNNVKVIFDKKYISIVSNEFKFKFEIHKDISNCGLTTGKIFDINLNENISKEFTTILITILRQEFGTSAAIFVLERIDKNIKFLIKNNSKNWKLSNNKSLIILKA